MHFNSASAQYFPEQLKSLNGLVTDSETDKALIGVHIFARVAHIGAVSDVKGKFQMKVDPNDTLIVTFVGYGRQVIPVAYFQDEVVDLFIQMDPAVIELPGLTITGDPDYNYLKRKGQNPYDIYKYKPFKEHPGLDVPAGSTNYGIMSRWGKEAKEKRKLLKVYSETGKDRVYIQTVSSDSVKQVFNHMYGLMPKEYNDFVIFLNIQNPMMDRQDPKDIIRVMHETFLRYKPRKE